MVLRLSLTKTGKYYHRPLESAIILRLNLNVQPAAGSRLTVDALSLSYGARQALDRVSLRVAQAEVLCLLGPSGSGKSTLLRLVAGVERPSSGRIAVGELEVVGPGRFVEPELRGVGMVFQDYALFPHLTVAANVAFGLKGRSRPEMSRIVGAMLERVGMDRFGDRYPHQLSGGERQRVALARALAPQPRVLLVDEPFSSLDTRLRDRVRQDTLDLLRETGTTAVLVTHDPDEAMRVADRIALLCDGRLVQAGAPAEIYTHPETLFCAKFFSDINELPGVCRNGRVDTPLGSFEASHLGDQTPACVCIRPQHLRLASGPTPIAARVVKSTFLGEVDHLELQVIGPLPGPPTPVTLRTFGWARLVPGDAVHLEVFADDVLVVPQAEPWRH